MEKITEGTLVVAGETPDATQFKNRAESKLATAQAFVIETVEQRDEVLEWVRSIKKDKADLDALCDPAIQAAHMEHKARINVKNQYAVPLTKAEEIAKEKLSAFKKKFDAEQEVIRLANEKAAREKEEADRKERKRIADEAAEVERLAREKEERERRLREEIESGHLSAISEDEQRTIKKAADAAAKAGNEKMEREARIEANRIAAETAEREEREKTEREAREKREREAQAVKDAEAKKERDRIAAEAEAQAEKDKLEKKRAAAKEAEANKAKGASFTTVYSGNVPDDASLLELAKAVVAGSVQVKAITANKKWIDDFANSCEGAVKLPGVVYSSEDRVAVRK